MTYWHAFTITNTTLKKEKNIPIATIAKMKGEVHQL